jgi:hypothetical protein
MPLTKQEKDGILAKIANLDGLDAVPLSELIETIALEKFIEGFDTISQSAAGNKDWAIRQIFIRWANMGFEAGVSHVLSHADSLDPQLLRFAYDWAITDKRYMLAVQLLAIAKEKQWEIAPPEKFLTAQDLKPNELTKILDLARQYPNIPDGDQRNKFIDQVVKFNIREAIDILLTKPEYSKEIAQGILAKIMSKALPKAVKNNILFYTLAKKPFSPKLATKLVQNVLVKMKDDLTATQLLDQLNQQRIKLAPFDNHSFYLTAVEFNSVYLLDALFEQDPNIDFQDLATLNTPLGLALKMKNLKTVKWLLDHNAAIHFKDADGNTPLFLLNMLHHELQEAPKAQVHLAQASPAKAPEDAAKRAQAIRDITAQLLAKCTTEDLQERNYFQRMNPLEFASAYGHLELVTAIANKMDKALLASQINDAYLACVKNGIAHATKGQLAVANFLKDQGAQIAEAPQLHEVFLPYSNENWINDIDPLNNVNFDLEIIVCALSHVDLTDDEIEQHKLWAYSALALQPPKVEIAQLLLAINSFPAFETEDWLNENGYDGEKLLALAGIDTKVESDDYQLQTAQVIKKVVAQRNTRLLEYIVEFTPNVVTPYIQAIKGADPATAQFLSNFTHEGETIVAALKSRQTVYDKDDLTLENKLQLREALLKAIAKEDRAHIIELFAKGVDLDFEQPVFPDLPDPYAGLTPLSAACRVDDQGHTAELILKLGANVHFANKVSQSHYSQGLIEHEKLRTPEKINLCRKLIAVSQMQPRPARPLPLLEALGERKKGIEAQLMHETKAAKQISAFMLERKKMRDVKLQSQKGPKGKKPIGPSK